MLHVMDALLAHRLLSSGCRLCGGAPGRQRLRLSGHGAAQWRVFCSVETCASVCCSLWFVLSTLLVTRQLGRYMSTQVAVPRRAATAQEAEAKPAKQGGGNGKGNAKQPGRGQKAATSSKEEDIRALRLDKASCTTHPGIKALRQSMHCSLLHGWASQRLGLHPLLSMSCIYEKSSVA